MASYRLGDAALADLDRIYEYGILTFGLEQADRYFDGLVCLFQQIADSPLSHPAVDEIRAGYCRARYYANSVYYHLEGDRVDIVRILGRQDPSGAFYKYGYAGRIWLTQN